METKVLNLIYNIMITLLAVCSIVLTILDICSFIDLSLSPFFYIDNAILLVFTIDYIVRFVLSEKKQDFFKHNICDLIAIIPFSSIFSFFRIARILRIVKIIKVLKFVKAVAFLSVLWRKIKGILETNGFIYVLYTSAVLILISSIISMFVENQSFEDALWWSIVTCTTVGYGDISPTTGIGRIIAVVLMLFGIGLIGMLTGAITTYFTTLHKKDNTADTNELQNIINDMNDDEIKKLTEIAKILKQ